MLILHLSMPLTSNLKATLERQTSSVYLHTTIFSEVSLLLPSLLPWASTSLPPTSLGQSWYFPTSDSYWSRINHLFCLPGSTESRGSSCILLIPKACYISSLDTWPSLFPPRTKGELTLLVKLSLMLLKLVRKFVTLSFASFIQKKGPYKIFK